jgi:uncharacterized membrane protein
VTAFTDRESSEEQDIRGVAAERLTFFGDAVIAIALTLLALELPMPEGTTNSALLHSAFAQREEYLAFVISFVVIAAHWRTHHRIFRYVVALNRRLTGLTLWWLLMQVITPFATKVLNGPGAFQARFIFYALVQLCACGMFLLMLREIRRDGLQREHTPPEVFSRAMRRMGVMAGAFVVSLPIAFVTQYAYLCWIVVPVADDAVRRLRRR